MKTSSGDLPSKAAAVVEVDCQWVGAMHEASVGTEDKFHLPTPRTVSVVMICEDLATATLATQVIPAPALSGHRACSVHVRTVADVVSDLEACSVAEMIALPAAALEHLRLAKKRRRRMSPVPMLLGKLESFLAAHDAY